MLEKGQMNFDNGKVEKKSLGSGQKNKGLSGDRKHGCFLGGISYLIIRIYSLSGHRLLHFLKNPLSSLFTIEKPMLPNLTLS